jgi:phosphatidylserine/phosphatidylglycerophosphate/cardiolipin synthase-like enzyme
MAAIAKPFDGLKLTEFQARKVDRDRRMADESFHHPGIHIHSKIILADPFGPDPVLVTGSANFSTNSTINNDSNVLVFRGDTAVADVYVADFMRMFEHYWFRSRKDAKLAANQIFALKDTDIWSERYFTAGTREQRDRLAFLGLIT